MDKDSSFDGLGKILTYSIDRCMGLGAKICYEHMMEIGRMGV